MSVHLVETTVRDGLELGGFFVRHCGSDAWRKKCTPWAAADIFIASLSVCLGFVVWCGPCVMLDEGVQTDVWTTWNTAPAARRD